MMDTVHLVYTCKERLTSENSPFNDFSRNNKGFVQAILNGKDFYKEYGQYYPSLAYRERPVGGGRKGCTYELVIQFSIPKLIYGNNLYECDERRFDEIVEILHERLVGMGVNFIKKSDISHLYVRRMDVGKNIQMKNRLEVQSVIRSVATADMTKRLDLGETDYKNGGHMVRFHSTYEDVTIYNKGKDLERAHMSEKKSVDEEAYMADGINNALEKISVVRLEIKMSGKRVIERRMKAIGLKVPEKWEFQNLFKNNVCRTLLQARLNEIIDCIPKIPLDDEEANGLLYNLMEDESKTSKKGGLMRSLARYGLSRAIKDGLTMREVQTMAENTFGKYSTVTLRQIRASPSHRQLKNLLTVKKAVSEFKMLEPSSDEQPSLMV